MNAATTITRLTSRAMLAVAAGMLLSAPAAAGPAVGQFELKDLESEAGSTQFQSQNAYSLGQPRREIARDGGETIYDGNTVVRQRHALEMELGFSRYVKTRIGIEFEKERIDDPVSLGEANGFDALTLSEIGGEMIVVLKRREGDGWGLGTVVEVEHPLGFGEQNDVVLGTILELQSGPWALTLQPMAVNHYGGEPEEGVRQDNRWDFAYAAKLAYEFSSSWTLALEAYGTIDRVWGTGHAPIEDRVFGDHDQHRAGPVLYYARPLYDLGSASPKASTAGKDEENEVPVLTVGLGYLAGFNDNTPDSTLKLSIEVDY